MDTQGWIDEANRNLVALQRAEARVRELEAALRDVMARIEVDYGYKDRTRKYCHPYLAIIDAALAGHGSGEGE
jgi:hypothetical protein